MSAVKKATKAIDLSGLENFDVSSLMQAGAPEAKVRAESNGKPLEIPVADIVELSNVRGEDNPGFSKESIAELAESLKESQGVKTPISVGPKILDGEHAGKYPLHHGARRLRASRVGGFKTIKGFIDEQYDEYDQAIENIQREDLTPMEIARFIAKREAEPFKDSRVAIAKRLGKSKAFITQHASLLVLSDELLALYDEGRCRDVLALYELGNIFKKNSEAVLSFIAEAEEITRTAVDGLKTSLKAPVKGSDDGDEGSEGSEGGDEGSTSHAKEKKSKARKASIMVKYAEGDGLLFVLRLDIEPSALHLGWIEDTNTGETSEVELSDLVMDSIVLA